MRDTAVLLIDCPDRKGLVAGVASALYRHGANITHADQHQDHEAGLFFMRVEWMLEGFALDQFRAEFSRIADELKLRWRRFSFPSTYIAWWTCCTASRPAS